MSFLAMNNLQAATGNRKEKANNKRRSSTIKQTLSSFLGSGNPRNRHMSITETSGGDTVDQTKSGRRSSAPAISGMPEGISPMIAFGTPYSMIYGSPDYMLPHEMSVGSGMDTDCDERDQEENASTWNFRDDVNDIYDEDEEEDEDEDYDDSEENSRSFMVRHLYSDSYHDNTTGDDGHEITSLHMQGDDGSENLGRKTTLMSTNDSVTGSNYSNVSHNLRKSARKLILDYLSDRGFLKPKKTSTKDGLSFHIATSSDTVFLKSVYANEDEYLNHLNRLGDQGDSEAVEGQQPAPSEVSRSDIFTSDNTEADSTITANTNISTNDLDDVFSEDGRGIDESSATIRDDEMVPYNIAVILSVKKPMELSSIRAEMSAKVRMYWPRGLPPLKAINEEQYNIGQLKWDFNLKNYNLFVGRSATQNELVVKEQTDFSKTNKTRLFKSYENEELIQYLPKATAKELFLKNIAALSNSDTDLCLPGYYVFILPIVFANNIPETLYVPCGIVDYEFRCGVKICESNTNNDGHTLVNPGTFASVGSEPSIPSDLNDKSPSSTATTDTYSSSSLKLNSSKFFKKMKNHFHISGSSFSKEDIKPLLYTSIQVPIVRTPPLRSISTADKPIYINRVWTDCLSYEISFAQKYVPLGAEVPVKIKLVPLVKNLSIKRIRVSVVEKITYVSKNLEFEFDQIEQLSNDPYSPYYPEFMNRRKRERILPLLEIRTRERGGRAIREDIVENCRSENLLSYFSVKDEESHNEIDMVEPLMISANVKFPKYKIMDKKASRNTPPYGIDEFTSSPVQEPTASRRGSTASCVLDLLSGRKSRKNSVVSNNRLQYIPETKLTTNSNIKILKHSKHNEPKRGLYASSTNFRHIHVKHKLELMLRISKPDTTDPTKQRHFEVLIDTPINIVSDLCTYENIELPTYSTATMSEPNTQTSTNACEQLPTFEQAISVPNSPRLSPMGSPQIRASYDVDDLSIQQLMLSRATTQNADDVSTQTGASSSAQFTNLDEIMNSPASVPEIIFRNSFTNSSGERSTPDCHSRDPESDGGREISDYGKPPTYEEITPLL